MRKKFFDDRIFYDPKRNELWVARPDTKWCDCGEWQWFLFNGKKVLRPHGKIEFPNGLIEVAREPEFSIC